MVAILSIISRHGLKIEVGFSDRPKLVLYHLLL